MPWQYQEHVASLVAALAATVTTDPEPRLSMQPLIPAMCTIQNVCLRNAYTCMSDFRLSAHALNDEPYVTTASARPLPCLNFLLLSWSMNAHAHVHLRHRCTLVPWHSTFSALSGKNMEFMPLRASPQVVFLSHSQSNACVFQRH